MSAMDMQQLNREAIRWYILVAVNSGRPYKVAEPLILSALQAVPFQCTALDLRRELDYLEDRDFIELERNEGRPWRVEMTRHGVDFYEYNMKAEPGIARPKRD